ncbi:hypothetical protein ACHAWT_003794 [Skeletonema menzelii]
MKSAIIAALIGSAAAFAPAQTGKATTALHGRICQLAFLGQITTRAGFYLPGYISTSEDKLFSDVGQGWAGSFDVPVAGALQMLAFVGFLELAGWKQAEGSFPGDFSASSFPVGWLDDYDEETKLQKRAIELNNGRAARPCRHDGYPWTYGSRATRNYSSCYWKALSSFPTWNSNLHPLSQPKST